jgi:hypothetical protein
MTALACAEGNSSDKAVHFGGARLPVLLSQGGLCSLGAEQQAGCWETRLWPVVPAGETQHLKSQATVLLQMVKRPAIYTSPCTLVQVFCLPSSTSTGSSAVAILHALITIKLFREASNLIRFKCCLTIG